MSKGVLLFAQNNASIDYIKQAIFCAKKIKQHLNLSVALATDNKSYLEKTYPFYKKYIEHVIETKPYSTKQRRNFKDGTMSARELEWKNHNRGTCYELSPFNETIVMDTDFIIGNDTLLQCFNTSENFLIHRNVTDVNMDRPDEHRFNKISDRSIDMYWATLFYFKKSKDTKSFFDLIEHIRENWNFYRLIYQIPRANFRNDFAFSIAIHILNGFQRSNWPRPMPGNMWLTTDSDILLKTEDDSYTFLLDKKEWLGQYHVGKVNDVNVHIMNKFSLNRAIDKDFENE